MGAARAFSAWRLPADFPAVPCAGGTGARGGRSSARGNSSRDSGTKSLTSSQARAPRPARFSTAIAREPAAAARATAGRWASAGRCTFFLRGSGRVVSVTADEIGLAVNAIRATRPTSWSPLGLVFGNAVRDGTGLLDADAFPNAQQFNDVAAGTESPRRVTGAARAAADRARRQRVSILSAAQRSGPRRRSTPAAPARADLGAARRVIASCTATDASSATSDVLLNATGITKSFPGVRALDGVNLTVRRGRLNALLGENGAGKSTMMNILAGVFSARCRHHRARGAARAFRQSARGPGRGHLHHLSGAEPRSRTEHRGEHLHRSRAAQALRPRRLCAHEPRGRGAVARARTRRRPAHACLDAARRRAAGGGDCQGDFVPRTRHHHG